MRHLPDVRSMIATGMRFVDERRQHAGQLGSSLTADGRQAVEDIEAVVEDALRRAREQRDALRRQLRSGFEHQLGALGLATRDDLRAIEHQLVRMVALRAQSGSQPAGDPPYREILRTTLAR